MSSDCNILNPLQRDGASQLQRLVDALRPAYVSVDERSLADLLVYTRKVAAMLRYYTLDNVAGGDWVAFIENDISTLVALIAATDFEDDKNTFDALHDALDDAADKPAAFAALFPPIVALAKQIDTWYRPSVEGLALHSALYRFITSMLSDAYRNLIAYAAQANEVKPGMVASLDESWFSDAWSLDGVESDVSLFQSSTDTMIDVAEIEEAARRVAAVFETFYEVLSVVVNSTPDYLQETLDDYAEHQPHMALFLAFLLLFKYAQDHLNEITEKHLNFYYQEVLQLDYKAEQPDEVHLVFALAKTFFENQLKAGTPLKAGKDDDGKNLFYNTDDEIVLNTAALSETDGLKTIFIDKTDDTTYGTLVKNIYAAPDADSADGEGAEIEEEDGKWQTFGSTEMPYAEVGFAIASPILLLAEGARKITVTFVFEELPALITDQINTVREELEHNVKVELSGAKAWIPATVRGVSIVSDGSTKTISFRLKLLPEDKAVVAYNKDVLDHGFETEYPVMRFVFDNEGYSVAALSALNSITTLTDLAEVDDFEKNTVYHAGDVVRDQDELYRAAATTRTTLPTADGSVWEPLERSYPYRYFQPLTLHRLVLDVDVEGVQNVILENDLGVLNPAKPFMPFGPLPKVGSSLYVGNHEIFQKSLATLKIDITWGDLPAESFENHYLEYDLSSDSDLNNDAFKVNLQVLKDGTWTSVATQQPLFTPSSTVTPPDDTISFDEIDVLADRKPSLETFTGFKKGLERGFVRLYLLMNFFHTLYPTQLAAAAIDQMKDELPNQPYTPLITAISLDYSSKETIDFTTLGKSDYEDRVEQLFHIYPFGQNEFFPIAEDDTVSAFFISRRLVPVFEVTQKDDDNQPLGATDAEGSLYLGIENLDPPQNLAVLFQVAEGSADPEKKKQDVVWSYLAAGVWIDFETTEILSDKTNGLLTSGIIQFALPKEITDDNTAWPSGMHWLKASVANDTDAVSQLIAVRPQAVKASFDNQDNDPNHLATALEAQTIKKLKTRQAAIKTIEQPYASFNGRMVEQEEAFYVRVSERLRHKQRAVTIFDYEHLVLEAFPEVYKVRCINHTDQHSEYAPGKVKLIVVPDLRNKNAVDPLQPRVSLNTLDEIKDYLSLRASDFVTLDVKNPSYELVQVDFKVAFQPGKDQGYYTNLLEEDVIKFLSPWLYAEGADLAFGGRIHRSWILNFVEERDYVDYVTDFQLHHIVEGTPTLNVEEAVASTSSSVLVSANTHTIGETNVLECQTTST